MMFWRLGLLLAALVIVFLPLPPVFAATSVATDLPTFDDVFNDLDKKASSIGLSGAGNAKIGTGSTLLKIITWFLGILAILAFGAIVWGGIMYVVSLGDEAKAGKAKSIILYAIVGVVVALAGYAIIFAVRAAII